MASSTMLINPAVQGYPFPQPSSSSSSCCPSCGHDIPSRLIPSTTTTNPSDAHRRIVDLESQVRVLNSKAAAAADKLADYEDEVRYLRAACARSQHNDQRNPTPAGLSPPLPLPNPQQSRLSSLSALLPGRKREVSTNSNSTGLPGTPATATFPSSVTGTNSFTPPKASLALGASPSHSTPNLAILEPEASPPGLLKSSSISSNANRSQSLTLTSLQSSLDNERTLRMRAETNLTQTQTELEELTAQLFGQANEMVATERKARAKLEERVKVLEIRDVEKRRRLDRLEKALERIERVRGLVG